jgi:DNA polymerase V
MFAQVFRGFDTKTPAQLLSVFDGLIVATHGEMVTLVIGVRFPEGLKYTGWMNSIISSTQPVPILDVPLPVMLLKNQVDAGFPSPAEDLGANRIDLAKVLITHPQATYFLRARGHSMVESGIFDNDILVVDRAIKPRHGHIVVAIVDGDFTVKLLHQRAGRIKLKAANPTFADIVPKDGQTLEVWGVVTSAIKQFVA